MFLMSKEYPYIVLFKIINIFCIDNLNDIICFKDDDNTPVSINKLCEMLVINTTRFKKILDILKPYIIEISINGKRYLKIKRKTKDLIHYCYVLNQLLKNYSPMTIKECRKWSKRFRTNLN